MTPQDQANERSKSEIGRALTHIARQINKEHMATVLIQDRNDPTKIWLFSFEAAMNTEQLADHLAKGLAHIKKEHTEPEVRLNVPRASGKN